MVSKVMDQLPEAKRLSISSTVSLTQQIAGSLTSLLLLQLSLQLALDMTFGLETQEEISTARATKVLLQTMTDGTLTLKKWETLI